eukprot:4063493-Amphidinium_carterae.2
MATTLKERGPPGLLHFEDKTACAKLIEAALRRWGGNCLQRPSPSALARACAIADAAGICRRMLWRSAAHHVVHGICEFDALFPHKQPGGAYANVVSQ